MPIGGFDLNALVAQIVPIVITKVMNGGIDLSNLGALLDWRKAEAEGGREHGRARGGGRGAECAASAGGGARRARRRSGTVGSDELGGAGTDARAGGDDALPRDPEGAEPG